MQYFSSNIFKVERYDAWYKFSKKENFLVTFLYCLLFIFVALIFILGSSGFILIYPIIGAILSFSLVKLVEYYLSKKYLGDLNNSSYVEIVLHENYVSYKITYIKSKELLSREYIFKDEDIKEISKISDNVYKIILKTCTVKDVFNMNMKEFKKQDSDITLVINTELYSSSSALEDFLAKNVTALNRRW